MDVKTGFFQGSNQSFVLFLYTVIRVPSRFHIFPEVSDHNLPLKTGNNDQVLKNE